MPTAGDLRQLLRERANAVLALASGGCARYIFSTEVPIRLDDDGVLRLTYESDNPFHHDIMANSALHLRLLVDRQPDGTEQSHLVLTGRLVPDAGNAPSPARPYRFAVRAAHLEFASGRRMPVPPLTTSAPAFATGA